MYRIIFLLITMLLTVGCAEPHNTDSQEKTMKKSLPSFVQKRDNKYVLTRNDVVYTVSPDIGGRIESLQFQGRETMLTPESGSDDLNQWGNVFWPSPQANWGWPPLPVLDYKPHTVTFNENFLILTSDIEPKTKLQFEKHYGFSKAENSVHIHYKIHNRGQEPKTLAPWEITRFPPAGFSFFPTGRGLAVKGNFNPLPVTIVGDITWFAYKSDEIGPRDHKLMIDGSEGWLAHLNNNVLFVKIFEDIPPQFAAPNEGEIEIYTKGVGIYMEVEQQGAYATLQPGEHLEWDVDWALADFPINNKSTIVGNENLLRKARALVRAVKRD